MHKRARFRPGQSCVSRPDWGLQPVRRMISSIPSIGRRQRTIEIRLAQGLNIEVAIIQMFFLYSDREMSVVFCPLSPWRERDGVRGLAFLNNQKVLAGGNSAAFLAEQVRQFAGAGRGDGELPFSLDSTITEVCCLLCTLSPILASYLPDDCRQPAMQPDGHSRAGLARCRYRLRQPACPRQLRPDQPPSSDRARPSNELCCVVLECVLMLVSLSARNLRYSLEGVACVGSILSWNLPCTKSSRSLSSSSSPTG